VLFFEVVPSEHARPVPTLVGSVEEPDTV
jgi:hypothetical protein